MPKMRNATSLSRDFSMLAIVIVAIALLMGVWISWSATREQHERIEKQLHTKALDIFQSIDQSVQHSMHLLEAIGRQISLHDLARADEIASLLHTYDSRPMTYGRFSWIDVDSMMKVSSNRGVLQEPEPFTHSEFQKMAMLQPWQPQMTHATMGRIEGTRVLPVVMGITDHHGKYNGTLLVSLDIAQITGRLYNVTTMPGIRYAILDHAGNRLGSIGVTQETLERWSKDLLPQSITNKPYARPVLQAVANDSGKDPFTFRMDVSDYPFSIIMTYDQSMMDSAIRSVLMPKLIELTGIALFLIIILWMVRYRLIQPAVQLAKSAAGIARGSNKVDIPDTGPVEIVHLGRQLQRIRNYIEERRLVEEELRRKTSSLHKSREMAEMADRAKSEFLASMSHELRTPLNAIIGFADVLRHESYGPMENEKYLEYAHDIHQSGQHVLDIINDILDLSRVEAGVITLKNRHVDIADIASKVRRLMQERAVHHNITIVLHVDETLPLLYADPLRITQILLNLMSNAVKFTPDGGMVTLHAHYRPEEKRYPLVVQVEDTGIGMTKEQIPIALSKYGQVEHSQKREFAGGTGLGLPLAQELTALHDAQFGIESEKGRGTTVSLHFPAQRVILRDEADKPQDAA